MGILALAGAELLTFVIGSMSELWNLTVRRVAYVAVSVAASRISSPVLTCIVSTMLCGELGDVDGPTGRTPRSWLKGSAVLTLLTMIFFGRLRDDKHRLVLGLWDKPIRVDYLGR